jgi:acyl-CoA hydrolase
MTSNIGDGMSSLSVGGTIDTWKSKEITLEDVPGYVPNGSTVYIGSTAATPEAVLLALVNNWKSSDIQIIQMLPGGRLPHLFENIDRFRTISFFSYRKTMYYSPGELGESIASNTESMKEGLADYKPMSLSSMNRLLEEKIITIDVAIIKVTKPHKGFCSLGFGVDCTIDILKYAKVVIAEVTQKLPWTEGPSKIPISSIHYWILHEEDSLKTTNELWPEYIKSSQTNSLPASVIESIGKNIAREIPDGSTLKLDWHPLVYAAFPYMKEHKNLGLHTDVFVDGLYQLQEMGVINNTKKSIDKGRTVVSQAHGSNQQFYDFLDRNPAIEFHSSSYVNDPLVMSKIDNLVVLIAALKIDLTGQVTTDSIGHKFYGGVWSTQDSIIGARLSQHGKPIIVLPSRSSQGRSNIVFALPPGTGISVTRSVRF